MMNSFTFRTRSLGKMEMRSPHFIPGPDSDPHWHYWNRVNGETLLKELVQHAAGNMSLMARRFGHRSRLRAAILAESLGIPV
ncbi:MAG: hypothetical protein R3F23_00400 [Verrucomicrobiia bacterium]